jgi:hypothetical protein
LFSDIRDSLGLVRKSSLSSRKNFPDWSAQCRYYIWHIEQDILSTLRLCSYNMLLYHIIIGF